MVQPANQPRSLPERQDQIRDVIRRARKARDWTQAELAKRCGWTHSTISRMERGDRGFELKDLWTLVDVLEIPPERFGLAPVRVPHPRGPNGVANVGPPKAPAQLPMLPQGFVGRKTELATLQGWHQQSNGPQTEPGVKIVVITGTAGVGKTTLARRWAHQVKGDFPGGNLYVDLRGFDPAMPAADPSDVLAQFLQSLGASPDASTETLEGRAGLYRSYAADRKLLVVLDNAANSDQVRTLLPGSTGCLVIVTSRNDLSDLAIREGAKTLTLDVLPFEDAQTLLAQRVGDERVARDPDATATLIESCARLPLAVVTVGSRAMLRPHFSLRALATELLENLSRSHLYAFDSVGTERSVRAVLACSYDPLPENVKKVFRMLALHPGPDITIEAAASLTGLSRETAQSVLVQLARANLLQESSILRYSYHDLLRLLASELVQEWEDSAARAAAIRRFLDHCLRSAYAASVAMEYKTGERTLEPPEPDVRPEEFSSREEALSWYQREIDVLIDAARLSMETGYYAFSWKLTKYIDPYLDFAGSYFSLESSWRLALDAAERSGDLSAQALCRHRIGHALAGLGHATRSLDELQRAVDIRRTLGDVPGEAKILLTMVDLLDEDGDLQSALDHATRALSIAEGSDDSLLAGKVRNAYAWITARSGDLESALPVVDEALRMHRERGHVFSIGAALDTRAYIRYRQGRYRAAVADFLAAIEIWQDRRAHLQLARSLERLAYVHLASGSFAEARSAAETALSQFRKIENGHATRSDAVLRLLDHIPESKIG